MGSVRIRFHVACLRTTAPPSAITGLACGELRRSPVTECVHAPSSLQRMDASAIGPQESRFKHAGGMGLFSAMLRVVSTKNWSHQIIHTEAKSTQVTPAQKVAKACLPTEIAATYMIMHVR